MSAVEKAQEWLADHGLLLHDSKVRDVSLAALISQVAAEAREEYAAENMALREQLVGVVSGVMAGCMGVTIASNDDHVKPPRGSKLVHRCLLYDRLQSVLREATSGNVFNDSPSGRRQDGTNEEPERT